MDTKQLITGTMAAEIKGFHSLESFLYYVREGRAPKPVVIAGVRFWHKAEIVAWEPTPQRRGPKTTKGEANGKKQKNRS